MSSQQSNFSNEVIWQDYLNLNFQTSIFSENSEYMYELGNIYAARNELDEMIGEIISNQKKRHPESTVSPAIPNLKHFIDALDMLKYSSKRCVADMENQRKAMYQVAKGLIRVRSSIESYLAGRGTRSEVPPPQPLFSRRTMGMRHEPIFFNDKTPRIHH